MHSLIETMKRVAAQVVNTRAQPRWGIVQSVDPSGPLVRVMLQPEGVLTGWLPVLQQSAGPGATFFTVPAPGWQALILPDMGEAEHGIVAAFSHSNASPLPATANAIGTGGTPNATTAPLVAGETVIRAASGSVIRLTAGGDVFMQPGSGVVKIDGSIVCNGDVSDRHGSLDRLRGHFNAHDHGNVQAGGSNTSAPLPPNLDAE